MHPMSIMIKPSSSNCNMRCKYCFYFDEAANRAVGSFGFMDDNTMENIIINAMNIASHTCSFAFQGGEPTLIGLDYYIKFVEMVNKYNINNVEIRLSIQTNGLLIDDKWAKFLAENKFLVGVSLDGSEEINDQYRVDINGIGTFKRIMNTTKILDKYNVEYNILTVVNRAVAQNIHNNYKFFKEHNFAWQQYIPCLDPINDQRGVNEYSLTPELYTEFLKNLFDLWYRDVINDEIVSIRYFDNLLALILGYGPESCGMLGSCSLQYVIEADGQVYPCDFYMLDNYKLGNINNVSFFDIDLKRQEIKFIENSQNITVKCRECKWYGLCRGGCRREREDFTKNKIGQNYLCQSYIDFFEYAYPRLKEIAIRIQGKSVNN